MKLVFRGFNVRLRTSAYRSTLQSLRHPPAIVDEPSAPWSVTIQYDAVRHWRFGWHCATGTLIAPRLVLTCAHPFSQAAQPAGTIPVVDKQHIARIGGLDGEPYEIIEVEMHPGFDPATAAHDVAIAILDRDVDATPLPLDPRPAKVGDDVIVLGWPEGRDGPGLTRVRTTVIDSRIGGQPDKLCLANLTVPDDMRGGYSGGPVIRFDGAPHLIGVLSNGAQDIYLDGVGAPALAVGILGEDNFILRMLGEERRL